MPEILEMPKLSDTMTEGTVIKWLKKEGDKISSGDAVAEIETDKATMEVEAFVSGTLLKIVVPEGGSAPCKSPMAFIGAPGEKIDEALLKGGSSNGAAKEEAKKEAAPEPKKEAPKVEKAAPAASSPVASNPLLGGGRFKASPLAKKVAADAGVNLAGLTGTGPGGRIVKQDVLMAAASGGSGGGWGIHPAGPITEEKRIPLTNMRKTIAKRLVESKVEYPHFYLQIEVDAAPMAALREQVNASLAKAPKPVKLSFNDFVMKAVAEAIRKVPAINATWEGDAIRQLGSVHLCFAAAIPDGLITPVIKDAQNKNLKQINAEVKELAGKAKEGRLKPEEYTGGTFTVSNLGMYGIDSFSAIINPPQAAILAVGNVVKKPVVDKNDNIVVGQRLNLTLSCDHRVADGAVAAQFLSALRELIEAPAILLL
jgi:pyruvate dehydrogenase E2 component (dihydrolipoamide acetyltransferase)